MNFESNKKNSFQIAETFSTEFASRQPFTSTRYCKGQYYLTKVQLCCDGVIWDDEHGLYTCCGSVPCLTDVGVRFVQTFGDRIQYGVSGKLTEADRKEMEKQANKVVDRDVRSEPQMLVIEPELIQHLQQQQQQQQQQPQKQLEISDFPRVIMEPDTETSQFEIELSNSFPPGYQYIPAEKIGSFVSQGPNALKMLTTMSPKDGPGYQSESQYLDYNIDGPEWSMGRPMKPVTPKPPAPIQRYAIFPKMLQDSREAEFFPEIQRRPKNAKSTKKKPLISNELQDRLRKLSAELRKLVKN